jgi:hypothetical protein
MRRSLLSLIFAALAVGCLATGAQAGPYGGPSLDRILPHIRQQHPGTFYDAEGPFWGPDGQPHYRIKWMTPQGRVVWFDANARTGHVNGVGARRFNDAYGPPRDFDPQYERGRRRRDHFYGPPPGRPFGGGGGGRPRGPGFGWHGNHGGGGHFGGGGHGHH